MVSKKFQNTLLLYFLLGIMFLPNVSVLNNGIIGIKGNSSTIIPNSQLSDKTNSSTKLDLANSHFSQPHENQITSSDTISRINSNYILGQSDKFWVEDLGKASSGVDYNGDGKSFLQGDWADAMYQITAVVVNITQNAYVFVDSAIKDQYTGTNGLGSQIGQEFQTKIQPSDTRLGTPSDIDHNGKIIILIFPFKEDNSKTNYYTTGYFWPVNMHKPSTDPSSIYYYSAYKEIININDLVVRKSSNSKDDWAPTLAHEYFHLIHYKYNPYETLWLEEGLAVFAENLAGYKKGYVSYLQDINQNGYYLHAYDHSLTYFTQSLESYGQSFLFVQYLYQRFGLTFMKNIIQTNMSGLDAIRFEISQLHLNTTFNDIYSDWMITNVVNDQINDTYSYRNFTFKISQSQYDVNNKLTIVPDSFVNQQLPYWSNEFFVLPQSNLKPYLITFLPQLLTNKSEYQLTIVTFHGNTSWTYEKIPLVNQQSGSFVVNYTNPIDKKLLIVSSLSGTSSNDSSITQKDLYSTYFTNYNLFAESYNYRPVFELENSHSSQPSYYLNIYSLENLKLTNSTIANITMNVYTWNSNGKNPIITAKVPYITTNQRWFIDGNELSNLPNGQYYFTLTITSPTNQTTIYGLTFYLASQSSKSDLQITDQMILAGGVVVAIPVILILNRKRKRK